MADAWRMRAPRCKGISQVELVVIITVIGIAAAFAIPRFTHLQNDVRASEVEALSASLRSAAAAAHAEYVKTGANPSAVALEGRQIQLKNGYPDASTLGIQRAVVNDMEFRAATAADSVTYSKHDALNASECAVTYIASSKPSMPATVTNLKTGGC